MSYEEQLNKYRRWSATDKQEKAVEQVFEWLEELNKKVVGGTTIGKSPQTIILDLKHNGSDIYINSEGVIDVNDEEVYRFDDFKEELENL